LPPGQCPRWQSMPPYPKLGRETSGDKLGCCANLNFHSAGRRRSREVSSIRIAQTPAVAVSRVGLDPKNRRARTWCACDLGIGTDVFLHHRPFSSATGQTENLMNSEGKCEGTGSRLLISLREIIGAAHFGAPSTRSRHVTHTWRIVIERNSKRYFTAALQKTRRPQYKICGSSHTKL
jgi:hypothetical protein